MTDKNTWDDHAEDLMVERDELLEKVHRLEADRDRWRKASAVMFEKVFQLKRLDEIQIDHIEQALAAYNEAYNEG